MEMASGESDMYLGTDVGRPEKILLARGRGRFFSTHVSTLKMLRFLWRLQIWVKATRKKFRPPLPDLQVGPWLLAHPCVTCHSSPGGGGGGLA